MSPKKRTCIVAQTGCDILMEEAEREGIFLIPDMVTHKEREYYSQVDIDDASRVERQEVGELGAGVHLVGSIPQEKGKVIQTIRLMRYHELMDDRIDSAALYLIDGVPMLSGGARRDRNSYQLGLGMDYQLGGFTLGAHYDYQSRADFHANMASLKVQLAF